MIKKELLIEAITDFDDKLKEISFQCKNATGEQECRLEYFNMVEAWSKLENIIEGSILPFTLKQ